METTIKPKTPSIRFKGFTDEWEEKKLGDVAEDFYNGQTPSRFINTYWNGKINWLTSGELNRGYVNETIEKITVEGQQNANLRIVPKNTFIMSITGLEAAGTRGNCGILTIETTLNQSCMAIFPNERKLVTPFLFQWYRKIGEEYGLKFTQGTKQQSYNAEILKKLEISLPKKEEQTQIGDFFKNLDSLIAQKQQKLDKYTNIKKAFLEKMFPKDHCKVPELRFKGFSEKWEEKKLGEVAEIVAGGTPNTKIAEYWTPKEIPWMSSGEINNKRITKTTDMISQKGFENSSTKWIPENSVLIALAGQGKTRGTVAITEIPLTTNQSIAAIIPEKNICYEFIFQNLEKRYEEIRIMSSGDGSRGGLNKKIISELTFQNTDIYEQTKIGELFKKLDRLITLQQTELDKLKNIKKLF